MHSPKAFRILAGQLALPLALIAQQTLVSFDFDADTPGQQPSGGWTFSPSASTATNGAVVVDSGTTPASPLPGRALYIYDQSGTASTHARLPVNGGVNVSAVRAACTFQRMYAAADNDTRVHFAVGPAGLSLNNSDFRLFEVRLLNNGTVVVEYSADAIGETRTSVEAASYDTVNPNQLVVFVNSHSTETVAYDDGVLSGSLAPDMMDVYLNGASIGTYLTLKTPDPVNAPQIDFWASDADLGQLALYQDTSRQGGIVFDNLVVSELGGGGGGGGGGEPVVFLDTFDFADQTVGAKPVLPFATVFTPGTSTATNGFAIVDAGSTPANPMDTGKALYAYDLSTGASSHLRFDFAPANTSNVRVDFDFQRTYATDAADEDSRIHVAVCPAGLETNNSDFRPFEIRLLNKGTVVVNYNPSGALTEGRESITAADYLTEGVNHLTFLANGNNATALPYDDPVLGQGEVGPNAMALFLNGVNLGEYGFINTPDPVNAPQIAFFESTLEFGRLGIYQDTSRQGAIVIDNLSIREFAGLLPPAAPSGLAAQATGPDSILLSWTDNSGDETGFVVELLAGAEWVEAALVAAGTVSVEITGLDSDTAYTFRVRATNGALSDPSNEASATTLPQLLPVITMQPQGGLLPGGSSATLTVTASGPGDLGYQWYTGASGDIAQPVDGATGPSFVTPALTSTTSYWVRVSNANGSVDSATAILEVFAPRTIRIVSMAQLAALLPDALPGDTYVIDNGSYANAGIVFEGQGAPHAPITLRAATPGKVILTGNSYLEVGGHWMVVEGLVFTNGWNQAREAVISFRAGGSRPAYNCRVSHCAILDFSPPDPATDRDWIALYGTDNAFEHNLVSGHSNIGVTLVVWRSPGKEDRHRIAWNHFRNRADGGGQNGWETIRIGTSTDSLSASKCVVEYNLFEACDGEIETISNKSCENIYRYNTFWRNRGMLTLRHGDRCLVEGNCFLGDGVANTGGIRVIGEDHVVINNYIERTMGRDGAAITVYAGVAGSQLNEYFAAHDALIAHNTIVDVAGSHVRVGAGYGSSSRTVLPAGVRVDNNLFAQWETTTSTYRGPAADGEGAAAAAYAGNIASGVAAGAAAAGTLAVTVPWETGAFGLLRPQAGSPVVGAAVASSVALDFDGQVRDASPDAGADEVSDADGINTGGPMRPLETGPAWREAIDTAPPWHAPALRPDVRVDSPKYGPLYAANGDWIFHGHHNWLFTKSITTTDSMWFWSPVRQAWLWSSRNCFPFFHDAGLDRWVYLVPEPDGGALGYDSQQAQWIPLQ